MRRQIQLTRKAIKDLQSLQSSGALMLPQRLFENLANTQADEIFPHTKHMRDYKDLWRSRIDFGGGSSMRLIWTENQNDYSIKLLYADLKSDDTYNDDALQNLPRDPAYKWNGEIGGEWSLFLNGGYNSSPLLTQNQQKTSEKIGINDVSTIHGEDRRVGFFTHITQSPPGTGKTIIAALRACELHNTGWNVFLIVPEHLLKEVNSFRCIQSIPSDRENKFFFGTFRNWINGISPSITESSCSTEEERSILENLANLADKSGNNTKLGDISIRDTILFQLFALKPDESNSKNTVYVENKDRIESLAYIREEWWQKELKKLNKVSRSEFAKSMQKQFEHDLAYIPSVNTVGSIFIIDESQDYLLSELEIFKTICRKLHKPSHPAQLWLLGDLNQRIIPVDFEWGALELSRCEETNWQCFRNSRNILRFSNLFLEPATANARTNKTRLPCRQSDPDKSYEEGDRVKLICYPSISDAENFLDLLASSLGVKSKQNQVDKSNSLLYKLASRIKILRSESYQPKHSDVVEFLDVGEAKGREFEACIVFNIFSCTGKSPVSEDWWKWYTLLTRTRSRLLIVIIKEQYDLLLKEISNIEDKFEYTNSQDFKSIEHIIKWIASENNDLDFSANYKYSIEKFLCSGLDLEDPLIYLDTYEALENFKICGSERSNLENELLSKLSNYDREVLLSKLDSSNIETINPLLPCLILRGAGHYWDAAKVIESLKKKDPTEHQRVIEEICKSLETMGLHVEAARIRYQMLGIDYPADYPMPHLAMIDGDLMKALVVATNSRLSN
jgi:mRNA-degrading endonuclease RelE of RelBE toxin-antitoxin system